jgi:tRNA1Val (adenine37-N6)-methyltransferase
MKVGTDAILLGAWADVSGSDHILDVGTGSGVIALMLAQRNEQSRIQAIDIDRHSIEEAKQNIRRSPWSAILEAEHISFQELAKSSGIHFDHIVSNPPFFEGDKRSIYPSRTKSRHTVYLSHDEFMSISAGLTHEGAKLSIILPSLVADYFLELADVNGFYLSRETRVRHLTHRPVKRVLLEFTRKQVLPRRSSLVLYDEEGIRSESFDRLTKEFYL